MNKVIRLFCMGMMSLIVLAWVVAFQWSQANAQAEVVEPYTEFVVTCQVQTDTTITVFWGYKSSGGEYWSGDGLEITTEAGEFPLLYQVVIEVENPQIPVYGLGHFTEIAPAVEEYESVFVEFDLEHIPNCGEVPPICPTSPPTLGQVDLNSGNSCDIIIPTVEPTPTDDNCPAWSVESATGNLICLWELPRAPT